MKNLTMKRVLAGVLGAATMIASSLTMASACTTIYAGANRTQEGTKFIARSEDYGSDMNKLWFVSEAGAYSGTYRGCPAYGPFTYELSHPSYRFTYFKNDNVYDGVCPECGEENAQHASYTEFGIKKSCLILLKQDFYASRSVLLITERTVTGFLPKPAVLRVIRAPMASDYVLFRFGRLFISKEAN